jgi:hypothetical protein
MFAEIGHVRCGCAFIIFRCRAGLWCICLCEIGPRGRLSMAIRRSALAGIYRSGRCETIRPMGLGKSARYIECE